MSAPDTTAPFAPSSNGSADPSQEVWIALLAPTGRDATLAIRVLAATGLAVSACATMDELCSLIANEKAAVLVIAEEAMDARARAELLEALDDQPSWSDIPIVLLAGRRDALNPLPRALSDLSLKGNVTLLDRPVRVATLTTVIRSAQRARQRQLDVRDLVESERSARVQAEEANAAKNQFLATMSHELRTPLNAIGGYAQLLALGLRGEVTMEQRADLARIDKNQRHLLSLINDILNFAKVEAGHVDIEKAPVDIGEVLDNLEALVEPQMHEKALKLSLTNHVGPAIALGDFDKITQILLNLLSNAIKFTSYGGRVDVKCTTGQSRIFITVCDDGSGIPRDKLEVIFDPFVQVGRDFTTPPGGTGLGLSISRDLARKMGGDLKATSILGEMSAFTLTLPCWKNSPGSDAVRQSA